MLEDGISAAEAAAEADAAIKAAKKARLEQRRASLTAGDTWEDLHGQKEGPGRMTLGRVTGQWTSHESSVLGPGVEGRKEQVAPGEKAPTQPPSASSSEAAPAPAPAPAPPAARTSGAKPRPPPGPPPGKKPGPPPGRKPSAKAPKAAAAEVDDAVASALAAVRDSRSSQVARAAELKAMLEEAPAPAPPQRELAELEA